MPIDHARDNLKCPQLSWDRWDNLDQGLGGVHGAYQGQPGMSTVVLGQVGHVSMPGTTWDVHGCHGTECNLLVANLDGPEDNGVGT